MVFTTLIFILLSISTYIIFTYRRQPTKKKFRLNSTRMLNLLKEGRVTYTKPNIQPVYPEIPIIPIVNNISPEPTIAVIQINPT